MHSPTGSFHTNVKQYELKVPPPLGYYLNVLEARRLINRINPQVMNTHYASGYGTLSRLIDFHPVLLSVWGADVYDFPNQSHFKEKILRKNLMAADMIASTSHIMKLQTKKYIIPKHPIAVTPFGVDIDLFKPEHKQRSGVITIGAVKKLHPKYGLNFLIQAFAALVKKHLSDIKFELVLAGKGPQEKELKRLTVKLKIDEYCRFTGHVPHLQVPGLLNTFNVFCAPSVLDSESFGVAVIEASACELPVVVTNVGGLPEVTLDRQTGLIVPPRDPNALTSALEDLVKDPELRKRMGKAGRDFVRSKYCWNDNADVMEQLYFDLLD